MAISETFINKIVDILKTLPVRTEISMSLTDKKETTYLGLKKENDTISFPDNKTFAFETGSVTKSFTCNLFAQLIVAGKVKPDAPVSDFLSFKLKGEPAITLKQLAMHTSGLPGMPTGYDDRKNFIKEDPFSNYSEEELVAYLATELKMDCLPDEKVIYSNLGSGLLGYVMSKIEGRPFSNLIEEKIFKPLQMHHSAFNIKNIATTIIKGQDKEGNSTSFWNGGILNGCLGIISTTEDLMKFARYTLNPMNKITDLQLSNTAFSRPGVYSAMGWVIVNLPGQDQIIKINGGTAGSASSVFINREKQKAFTFCSNIHPDNYMKLIEPLCGEIIK